MKRIFIFIVVMFTAKISYAEKLFLLQSTTNVDKYIIIPRDIKKKTLVLLIPSPCPNCRERLKPIFTKYDSSKYELILAVDGPLWRKGRDFFKKADWLPRSLSEATFHDPNGRLRAEHTSEQGVYELLLEATQ